jgi:OmpA-OmpF porin, OOP family
MMIRLCTALLLLCTLAACSGGSLQQLRDVKPEGDAFQNALSQHYLMLAEEEQKAGRTANATLFAEKGLSSAEGQTVFAESVREGVDYHDHKAALTDARSTLDTLFLTNIKTTYPKEAAEAQTLYECWIGRASVNAPSDATNRCKQEFFNRVQWLRDALQNASDTASSGKKTTADSYLVFFDWDKAALNMTALKNFRQISEEIIALDKRTGLAINGHTDTSGAAEYNMTLSEKRANTVKELLATYGVPKETMTTFAFGETDLDVPTADNVREPKNRRVEIFIE